MRGRSRAPGGARAGSRPWLRIGPGLALAVAASVLVWRTSPGRVRMARYSSSLRPEQTSISIPAPPAAPEIGFVLAKRSELGLTSRQVGALMALNREHVRATAALREALDRAARDFQADMGARRGEHATVEQLQSRTASVSDYSRQIYTARRDAWDAAARTLTAAQRRQAEALWDEEMSGRSSTGRGPRE